LYGIYTNRHWDDVPNAEKYLPAAPAVAATALVPAIPPRLANTAIDPKWDGQGHSTWIFDWDKGAYHIDHAANGGIPKCQSCGRTLVLVKGDDPYANGA
jgi:hypothetical protein